MICYISINKLFPQGDLEEVFIDPIWNLKKKNSAGKVWCVCSHSFLKWKLWTDHILSGPNMSGIILITCCNLRNNQCRNRTELELRLRKKGLYPPPQHKHTELCLCFSYTNTKYVEPDLDWDCRGTKRIPTSLSNCHHVHFIKKKKCRHKVHKDKPY